MLPENAFLGRLELLEIYEFYDLPALYTCVNRTNQLYLCVWVDETHDATQWLYTPISVERLQLVRLGQLDLHNAFAEPEDGFNFIASIANEVEQDDSVTILPARNMDLDLTPQPDSFIESVYQLPQIAWISIDQSTGHSPKMTEWLQKHAPQSPSLAAV